MKSKAEARRFYALRLKTVPCECQKPESMHADLHDVYPEDGVCTCGVHKHHSHCKHCYGIMKEGT
jgi:hypothetical protein